MTYVKTVRDNYNDEVEVEVVVFGSATSSVSLKVDDSVGGHCAYAKLAPKQARRLAKALRKAAKIAEENA